MNEIKWNVEEVLIPHDPLKRNDREFCYARLTGCLEGVWTGHASDLHMELQKKLDALNPDNWNWPKENHYLEMVVGRRNGKTELQRDIYKYCMNQAFGAPVTITNVIFNDPATIVFWSDDTKTVVKCQEGDVFDPEKGLAMAIVKKTLGNKGNYCNEVKKWTEKYYENKTAITDFHFSEEFHHMSETIRNSMKNFLNADKESDS